VEFSAKITLKTSPGLTVKESPSFFSPRSTQFPSLPSMNTLCHSLLKEVPAVYLLCAYRVTVVSSIPRQAVGFSGTSGFSGTVGASGVGATAAGFSGSLK